MEGPKPNLTGEQKARLKAITQELEALANEARSIPIGPDAREPLTSVMARAQALIKECEQVSGVDSSPLGQAEFKTARTVLENWDELLPIWEGLTKIKALRHVQPQTPESMATLLEQLRMLRAAFDAKRNLLPTAYYEEAVQGLDPIIAAIEPLLMSRCAPEQ